MPYPYGLRLIVRKELSFRLDLPPSPCLVRVKQQQRERHVRRNTAFRPILCTGSKELQALRTDAILCAVQGRQVRQLLRVFRCQENWERLLHRIRQGTEPRTGPNHKRTNPTTDRRASLHSPTGIFIIQLVPGTETESPTRR